MSTRTAHRPWAVYEPFEQCSHLLSTFHYLAARQEELDVWWILGMSRVQSQRFSASICSSTTAFGVACRFSDGNNLTDVVCRVPWTSVSANASAKETPKRTLIRMHTLWG